MTPQKAKTRRCRGYLGDTIKQHGKGRSVKDKRQQDWRRYRDEWKSAKLQLLRGGNIIEITDDSNN